MTQPEKAPQREEEGTPASAIPGAWAQPAAAFVDESSVVRPERGGGGSRVASLVVLSVLAVGAAGFAWGITVALQGLDENEAAVASAQAPSADAPTGARSQGAPTVPDADPSFPALPETDESVHGEPTGDAPNPVVADESVDELDVELPAPKLIRLARTGKREAEKPRKRYQRAVSKEQRKAARPSTTQARKRGKQAVQQQRASTAATKHAAAVEPQKATKPEAPRAAPTAASLTREAEKLYSAGQLSEARGVAERALGLSSGYPRAHRALAVICAKQGDTACARRGYETYLRLAPDAPDAPDVRRILGM